MQNFIINIGCILGATGVLMGAFGAHMLKDILDDYSKSIYQTATFYQMIHSLAIIFSYLGFKVFDNNYFLTAGKLFIVGIVLFSGSLYVISLFRFKWLGMITPFGGLMFILGWIFLLIGSMSIK